MASYVWPTPFNNDRANRPSSGGASGGSNSIAFVRTPSADPAVPDRTTSASEGPRLGSLTVNSSAYGQPRPILYGTIRVGGQMIWSDGIREKETIIVSTTDTNINTDTQYSYFAHFAMAFCEGVVDDVLRIWANGKLIFDKTTINGVGLNVRAAGLNFNFFSGSETQPVDPVMAFVDAGLGRETPAYRGTCYIMFTQFPLANYANALPKIEVELVINPPAVFHETIGTTFPGSTASFDQEWAAVDWTRGFVYYSNKATVDSKIAKVSLRTGQNILERDLLGPTILGGGLDSLASEMIVTPQGDLMVLEAGTGNFTRMTVLDGNTLAPKFFFGESGGSGGFAKEGWRWPNFLSFASCFDDDNQYDFLVACDTNFDKIGVLRMEDGEDPVFLWSNDVHDTTFPAQAQIYGAVGGKFQEGVAEAWVLTGPGATSSDSIILSKITIDKNAVTTTDPDPPNNDSISGLSITAVASFPPSSWKVGETDLTGIGGFLYDAANHALIICAFPDSDGGLPAFLSYNIDDNTISWSIDGLLVEPGDHLWHQSRLLDDTFAYTSGKKGTKFNTVTGEILLNDDATNWTVGVTGTGMAYDSRSDSTVGLFGPSGGDGPLSRTYFSRGDANTQSLETIVEDLAVRANMDLTDLDTNDLNTVSVPGYAVTNQSTGRGAIQVLADIFLFDSYESDWVLNFKMQGQSVSKALTESDLAWHDESQGTKYEETRKQEVELPERFTVNFMDNTNNYIITAQATKRVLLPEPAMSSGNTYEVSPPLVLTPTIAKRQAETLLYTSWVERTSFQYRWSWEFLELDPSDVITVTFDDGRIKKNRITSMDVGDGLTMEVRGIHEQDGQFDASTVEADGGAGTKQQTIVNFVSARSFAVDSPLLFDYDDIDRTAGMTYAFSSGYYDGEFDAVRLYYSPDNTNYSNLGQQSDAADHGVVLGAMPDPPNNNPHATDTKSTLNIMMLVGGSSLASVTYDQMLEGQNRAMLVRLDGQVEIIHYQNVTAEADGSHTLDTFLRGRRGTDTMTEDYDGTESIVLLSDEGSIIKIGLPLTELDNPSYYKFVASQQMYQTAGKQILVSNLRTLMPYAPTDVTAIEDVSNNIDFAWVRRSRIGGDLANGTGNINISEDTEEYEIDILDGPGAKATETFTSTSFASGWADETVTIDGKVYTFKTTLSDVDGYVLIGADEAECITNLISAINLDNGLGIKGTRYAGSTTVHQTVVAVQGAGKTMDITAKKYGTLGNSITLATDITGASWGASPMSGGANGTVLRSATGLSTPAHEYTNADIVTDFGAVPATITVQVFQVSAQAGRGFTQEVTLDVQ